VVADVAGVVLVTAAAVAVWNPTRLLAVDESLPGSAFVALLLALVCFCVSIAVSRDRRWFGLPSAVAALLLVVVLALLGVALLTASGFRGGYFTPTDPSRSTAWGDVELIRQEGGKIIDGDPCVSLELRVGSGLRTRHRIWARCDNPGWMVERIQDDEVLLTLHGRPCRLSVDRHDVNLRPIDGDACGLTT
jgi:hypothetical protein